jgi:hypothetical protein
LLLVAGILALTTASPAAAAEPSLGSGPTVSGVARVGKVLTATDAVWSQDGFPVGPTSKVWDRCSGPDVSSCVAITNGSGSYEDGKTYLVTSADLGFTLRVWNGLTVTMPSYARYEVWSVPTAVVTNDPTTTGKPVNTVLPKIKGNARVHKKLTVSTGTWTGATPTTFKYRWKKCDAKAKKCRAIPRATKASFTPGDKYVGRRLSVVVTATNSAGTTTIISKATPVIKK